MSAYQTSGSGTCTVRSGAHSQTFAAGRTVGDLRRLMSAIVNIDASAKAYSGTQEMGEDDVVHDGMSIMFTRKTGEKG